MREGGDQGKNLSQKSQAFDYYFINRAGRFAQPIGIVYILMWRGGGNKTRGWIANLMSLGKSFWPCSLLERFLFLTEDTIALGRILTEPCDCGAARRGREVCPDDHFDERGATREAINRSTAQTFSEQVGAESPCVVPSEGYNHSDADGTD